MNLGTRLCSYRKRAGMSQQELAEYLKVSRQSVSKWETDVAMPTIDNLQRLGELYGVPIDEFKDNQKYRKLPKGWTYDTKLFDLEWRTDPEDEKLFNE